jgi:hypothetical protein
MMASLPAINGAEGIADGVQQVTTSSKVWSNQLCASCSSAGSSLECRRASGALGEDACVNLL